MLTLSKTEGNSQIREKSRVGEDGRAALEVRNFPQKPAKYKAFCNEKGQPAWVGLVVLVEAAGIEPASVNPPPLDLHA